MVVLALLAHLRLLITKRLLGLIVGVPVAVMRRG